MSTRFRPCHPDAARRHRLFARWGLCLALLAGAPLAIAADAWTQEGQDAGAAGRNAEQTVLNAGNLGQLAEAWARDLDVWQQSTGIAIADGQVYVGRKVSDPDTTVRQQLVRLDLATGATVWKVNAPDSFATPVLTPELAIVAGNGLGSDDKHTSVRAYDRATGEPRWHYRHPGKPVTFRAPHLQDGVVYAVSLDGDAVALDAATGALLWSRQLDTACCGVNGPAVGNGVVIVGHYDGLIALDAADGHDLWRYDLPQFRIASIRPMIIDGVALLFDLDGKVHALDAATGALHWVMPTPAGDMARSMDNMASDGQRVFVLNGVVRPALSAIDLATGATLWSLRPGRWSHSAVVSNGVLYLATDKHLLAFDPATGSPLPIALLKSMRWGQLVIAEGHVLISGGPVRAFGLSP